MRWRAVTCTADPGCYRTFDAFARDACAGTARLEVLSLAVQEEGGGAEAAEGESRAQEPQRRAVSAEQLAGEMQRARIGCVFSRCQDCPAAVTRSTPQGSRQRQRQSAAGCARGAG